MDRFIEHYAKARQTASSGYYEDGSERDRGVRNQKIQYLGVAGEIIARNILKTNGKKYEASQLVSNVADLKPDLYIEYSQSKVDVKCFDDNEFKINYKKIERPKYEVDWFWFIKLEEEPYLADHFLVPYDDVRRYFKVAQGFTKYYSYSVNYTDFFATEDIYGAITFKQVIGDINVKNKL